jgi:hypothetical protein
LGERSIQVAPDASSRSHFAGARIWACGFAESADRSERAGRGHQRRHDPAAPGEGRRRRGNNILAEDRDGDALIDRGIVFAVDYIANSGGTIYHTER